MASILLLLLCQLNILKDFKARLNTQQNHTWMIHGGTKNIIVCSSIFYGVNSNFCCRHSEILKFGSNQIFGCNVRVRFLRHFCRNNKRLSEF